MGNWKYIIILAIVVTVIVTNIAGLWDANTFSGNQSEAEAMQTISEVRASTSRESTSDVRDTLNSDDARVYARAIALGDPSLCDEFQDEVRSHCVKEAAPQPRPAVSKDQAQEDLDRRLLARATALNDASHCQQIESNPIRADCEEHVS